MKNPQITDVGFSWRTNGELTRKSGSFAYLGRLYDLRRSVSMLVR